MQYSLRHKLPEDAALRSRFFESVRHEIIGCQRAMGKRFFQDRLFR